MSAPRQVLPAGTEFTDGICDDCRRVVEETQVRGHELPSDGEEDEPGEDGGPS